MRPAPLPVTALLVAKAPVPGLAKTRLAAAVGHQRAADIAAAALLDTLDAMASASFGHRVVALTGDLSRAARAAEISARLATFRVIPQRGDSFSERLANAHTDAAPTGPVLQIGMDTPQVTAQLLECCGKSLLSVPALLGMARDGGWWVLGVADPASAKHLLDVPMSHPDTGALTRAALQRAAGPVTLTDELTDVDTVTDIPPVRAACRPGSRFALATAGI